MVPKRLKHARKAAGLSQEKLAELVGIDGLSVNSRLSNYEVGRFTPPFDFVVKVAKVLDYPEAYFYTLNDDFAQAILELHRNGMNPEKNPYYHSVIEVKKLTEQLDEARAFSAKLSDCLKRK